MWCIYRKTEKCCNQFQKTNKQKKNNHDNKVGWVWVVVLKTADSQNRFGITEESSKGIPKGRRYTQDKM